MIFIDVKTGSDAQITYQEYLERLEVENIKAPKWVKLWAEIMTRPEEELE